MNQKVLRTLEYNKIVERLAEYAFGADTKERCLSLLPSTSLSEITNAQQQTKDAMNRRLKKGRYQTAFFRHPACGNQRNHEYRRASRPL